MKTAATLTVDQIMAMNPCDSWIRTHVVADAFGGDETRVLSLRDFASVEAVPVDDRLWVLVRHPLATDRLLRLFGCWCAEQALDLVESLGGTVDPRSREAVAVSRRFAVGEATLEELKAAAAAAHGSAAAAARSVAADSAAAAA